MFGLMTNTELDKISHKGDNVTCEAGFTVFHGADNIFLGSNISLVDSILNAGSGTGSITIEDCAFMGHGVKVLARGHNYTSYNMDRQLEVMERPIHIKAGAWIGSGSIILAGVTIGRHAVVAAGSIVTRDVREYTVVAGNPARVIIYDIRNKDGWLARLTNRVTRMLDGWRK
jgi:acetyltransferase-like isoleucine patch superfamily enzyme